MKKSCIVPLEGMKEIYDVACDEWKKKISEWTSPFTDTKLEIKQVEQMYKAANESQKEVLDKWLNKKGALQEKLEGLILPYPKANSKVEKSANAFIQMACIAEHYNDGVELKWENTNQYKYYPYKYFSDGRWVIGYFYADFDASIPLACCFKNKDLAIKAYEEYPEIYDDFYGF